jgi:hypothetical protein
VQIKVAKRLTSFGRSWIFCDNTKVDIFLAVLPIVTKESFLVVLSIFLKAPNFRQILLPRRVGRKGLRGDDELVLADIVAYDPMVSYKKIN